MTRYSKQGIDQQLTKLQRAYLREQVYPQLVENAENTLAKLVQESGVNNPEILKQIQQDTLVKIDRRSGEVQVDMTGVAAAFDSGWDYYDMKLHMLRSRKAKRTKDGDPYIDVPFQHENIGIISQAREEALWLGDDRINALRVEDEDDEKGEFWTKSLMTTGQKGRRGAFKKLEGQHKTGKYRGMTTIGTPTTFRRISKNSDIRSWINKGRRSAALGQQLVESISKQLDRVVKKMGS